MTKLFKQPPADQVSYHSLLLNAFSLVPHMYKFSRGVIFAVSVGNLSSTKIKSFETIPMHMELKGWLQMILKNETVKISSAKITFLENLYAYGIV